MQSYVLHLCSCQAVKFLYFPTYLFLIPAVKETYVYACLCWFDTAHVNNGDLLGAKHNYLIMYVDVFN